MLLNYIIKQNLAKSNFNGVDDVNFSEDTYFLANFHDLLCS